MPPIPGMVFATANNLANKMAVVVVKADSDIVDSCQSACVVRCQQHQNAIVTFSVMTSFPAGTLERCRELVIMDIVINHLLEGQAEGN